MGEMKFGYEDLEVWNQAYETMTLLEIFKRKGWISAEEFSSLKSEGIEIASMIKGLINSLYKSKK